MKEINRTYTRATPGNTKLDNSELAVLLLESFRYCLGRMTYAVSACVTRLIRHWDLLPPNWQQQIQGDIRHAIDTKSAGWDCDVAQWERILRLKLKDDPK